MNQIYYREENTDEGDSSPGNVIGSPEETETLINLSPHSTVILFKGQILLAGRML